MQWTPVTDDTILKEVINFSQIGLILFDFKAYLTVIKTFCC